MCLPHAVTIITEINIIYIVPIYSHYAGSEAVSSQEIARGMCEFWDRENVVSNSFTRGTNDRNSYLLLEQMCFA